MIHGGKRLGHAATSALRIGFVISLLWSTFTLAWVTLCAVDFGYPLLYRLLSIDEHVATFAPQNRFGRQDFVLTGADERERIVGEMIAAINRGGAGLERITYAGARGRNVPFLRQAERVHLQSVARLIDHLRAASYGFALLLVASFALLWWRRRVSPAVSRILLGALVTVAAGTLAVLALGPERVFNTLHTWIFPAGEQWYFYYQDSLMTTLLKAPDLFGVMAALWVALWLPLLAAAYAGSAWLLRKRAAITASRPPVRAPSATRPR